MTISVERTPLPGVAKVSVVIGDGLTLTLALYPGEVMELAMKLAEIAKEYNGWACDPGEQKG